MHRPGIKLLCSIVHRLSYALAVILRAISTLNLFVAGKDLTLNKRFLIYGVTLFRDKKLAKSGVEPYASIQSPAEKHHDHI